MDFFVFVLRRISVIRNDILVDINPLSVIYFSVRFHVFLTLKFNCSECRSVSGVSSDAGNSVSSVERNASFGIASSSRSDTDMFCQNFILNYSRKDGKKDDGDDNGSSDAEDFEVHIDLTDDLLHMVFIFFLAF